MSESNDNHKDLLCGSELPLEGDKHVLECDPHISSTIALDHVPASVPMTDASLNAVFILAQVIQKYADNKHTRFRLRDSEYKILTKILTNYPEFFGNLQEPLLAILSDGVVSFSDIPEMITIINTVSKLNIKKLKLKSQDILTLIGTIMFILVDSDTVKPCPGMSKEECIMMINVSIKTLESTVVGFKGCWCV